MKKRILITGGCGFIGHHAVEHLLRNTEFTVVVLDSLSYAARGFDRLRDIEAYDDRRVTVLSYDFTKPITSGIAQEIGNVNYILHMGAETHVDNSISDPEPFVMSNVVGTFRMLEFARSLPSLERFIYFSTDEVFGPAPHGINYREWDRYNSTNPYAATKAGGEELALAWANTYRLPVTITHTMNVFGERQHPEKFIPLCIRKIQAGETIQIHSDPTKEIPGSRHWIHARNVANALLYIINNERTEVGAAIGPRLNWNRCKINIVGEAEVNNLEMAKFIGRVLGKEPKVEMTDFHSSRPGHDLRYALNGDLLKSLGHSYPKTFEQSLEKTVRWMIDEKNRKWLEPTACFLAA